MIVTWLINWRTGLLSGMLVLVVICCFSPQEVSFIPAGWWLEQQRRGIVGWEAAQRTVSPPRWWSHVRRVCRWGQAVLCLSLGLWLLGYLLTQPAPSWVWLNLLVVWPVAVGKMRDLLPACSRGKGVEAVQVPVIQAATDQERSAVEVTIDLEPLLAELGDLSPTSGVPSTAREALTVQIERIRAECFQHPVGRVLMERIERETQQVVKQLLEEALAQELDEHLGFGRYERTGQAKPAQQHRSGSYPRSLRTVWGSVQIGVPKLRCGNKARSWKVLKRYERSFGPWLDLQLHLYLLGLSQRDLQEVMQLSFGQILSVKSIEHLTDVARQEMEAFRQATLSDTPPVTIIDGVNLRVLCSTGVYRTNQRGHRREVKRREGRVLLAALGVWPDGHYQILYFEMVDKETKANWRQFFEHLVVKGLDKNKLQLLVSDGRPGIPKAIRAVFPRTVKHQRCVFHKLKNLADNLTYDHLVLDPMLPSREARKQAKEERARAILQEASAIYASSDIAVIEQRLADFQQNWTSPEAKAVRCFVRDFDLTLNYLRVPFPHKKLIRTTNLLERFFREFRGRADEVGCFGSQAQAETLFYLVLRRERAKRAVA